MSQDDDLALFKAMMGDVKPLKNDTTQHTTKHQATESQLARREAAVCLHEDSIDALSLEYAPELKPNDIIEFKKDGVQDGVYKKLRLGKYPIQAKLNINQKPLRIARQEIVHFFKQCLELDIRTVIVVHGKGRELDKPCLHKSFIAQWLSQINEVQCAHSTQPHHGGTGAVYVLLRKSAEKKLETKERHQKRLG